MFLADLGREMMDLKKKIFVTGICCFMTFSVVSAKPADAPMFNGPVKMQASVNEQNEPQFNYDELGQTYKSVTREPRIMEALELMKGTIGDFSRNAILGNNISNRPIRIEFKNLATIKPAYANFDALGWKRGPKLYIYVNQKHSDAPAAAISALLSHEALHQDELDSLNEETYAWTMEAAVWSQEVERDASLMNKPHPLVFRENTLKKLFEKGEYTDKYIRKAVCSNPGYASLPERSPGYENENL